MEEMELELGTLLKKARQEKGLTLDDIQEETKIRKKYLEAIEENNFEILPGNVYLKVFIKGYAREVDINYQALLENYEILNIKEENESNLQKDYLSGTKVSNSSRNNNKRNSPLKIIFIILLILFLGAAVVYTYQYVNNSEIRLLNQQSSTQENIEKESELLKVENDKGSASAAEEKNGAEESAANNSKNDSNSNLEVFNDNSFKNNLTDNLFDSFDSEVLTEENTEIIDQNNFQKMDGLNSQEQSQINKIIVSEVNTEESGQNKNLSSEVEKPEAEQAAPAESTQTGAEEAETAADSVSEKPEADFDNSLTFSAADTVWVTVDRDGENVFSGILENGDQREFEVKERLYIKIGNGNAITAEINGEVYGPWAGNGEIAEVEFINQDQEFTINNLRD